MKIKFSEMVNEMTPPNMLSDFSDNVRNGIRYYHVSNRPLLSFLIISAVIGWQFYTIMLILSYTCEDVIIQKCKNYNWIYAYIGFSIFLTFALKLKIHQLVWFLFPSLTNIFALPNIAGLLRLTKTQMSLRSVLRVTCLCIVAAEFMVYIFFDRRVLSVLFGLLGRNSLRFFSQNLNFCEKSKV